MDVFAYNRMAWNHESRAGSEWSRPVAADVIERARHGQWDVILTPNRAVPRAWFGDLHDKRVLCLASGGGQQAPVLAAAGARVTSFDLSDEQLSKDASIASRDGLELRCIQGNMTDLSAFPDASFDLVFHPVSNLFVPDPRPVWNECHRVLKPGGRLLAGFMHPCFFLFDHDAAKETGRLNVTFALPYREPESLSPAQTASLTDSGRPMEYGHMLSDQIGGQLEAGFVLRGLYEDDWNDEATPLNRFCPTSIATWSDKPAS